MKFAHVRASGHFTFAEQIFNREAISLARKGKFRCVPALRQARRGVAVFVFAAPLQAQLAGGQAASFTKKHYAVKRRELNLMH